MKKHVLAFVFVLVFTIVLNAQNVGVGTDVPASKLEVKGLSGDENSIGTLRLTNNTGTTQLRFGTLDGTRSWMQTIGTLPLFINRLGNNIILNETAGSVGIGTASPVQKLEVNGRTVIRNGGTTYNNPGAAELQVGYALASSGTAGEVARLALQPYGHTGGPFIFYNRDDASSAYLDVRYGTSPSLLSLIHNGNLGLGTQNPSAKLHVIGSGAPQAIIDQAGGHSILDIRTTDATNFAQSLRFYRGGVHQGEIYTVNGDQRLRFYINGADRMQIDNAGNVRIPVLNINSAVYTDGSSNLTTSPPASGTLGYWTRSGATLYNTFQNDNVGVGVSAPQVRLDVRRSDNNDGDAIAFGSQTYYMGRLGESATTNKVYIANTYNHDFSFIDFRLKGNAESNSKMIIKGDGNVGIGTTDPAGYRLNVQQGALNSLFQSSSDAQIELKGTNEWAGIKWSDVGGTDYTWFWGATGTWAIGSGGSTVSGKKLHVHGGTSIGASYVQTSVPSNGLAVEGSLGVGTNSPAVKLHVASGGAIIGTHSSGSSNRTLTILNQGQAQVDFGSYPYDWSPAFQLQNNDNTKFIWLNPGGSGAYSAHNARFYTSGTGLDFFTGSNAFVATVSSDGKVGIGTSTPAQKLDVQGGYAAFSDIVGGSNETKAFVEGGNGIAYFGALGTQRAAFGNAETWETLVADDSNIGIGTSSPGARLDVQGPSGVRIGYSNYEANLVFGNISSWKSGIRVFDNGVAEMRIWHVQPSGKIFLTTGYNGDQSASLPSDGMVVWNNRVGIGNFSPSYKLDIAGQIYNNINSVLSDYTNTTAIFEQSHSGYNSGVTLRNPAWGDGAVLFGRSNGGGLNAGSITSWTGYVPVYASGFVNTSDITMKKDVEYLDENDFATCLNQIRDIQSIRYRYLTESATKEKNKQYRPYPHIGVVAQSLPVEVADSIDADASSPLGGQKLGMSLADMSGLMLAGMKALDAQNQMLQKQVDEMKKEIEALKKSK